MDAEFGLLEAGQIKSQSIVMQIDSDIMTTQQIKSLPAEEKLQIMEAIWEDMRDHYENAPIAPEVIDLLRHRQARVAAGDAKFLDWDQVKSALGRG